MSFLKEEIFILSFRLVRNLSSIVNRARQANAKRKIPDALPLAGMTTQM
jgi:hypothetical protein